VLLSNDPGKEAKKMYQYKVKKFDRIIDGDTVDILIDVGFDITIKQRVRLLNIDAPETRTKDLEEKERGLEAKYWLEKELQR
jgi:micrococcal nuclease